jgi:hypothetical protein
MTDKTIRFIDPQYNTLFTIPDGGNIVMTYPDGEQRVRACKYLDETHTRIGGNVFHICEFAERMQQAGATYEPENEPEIIAGYHIIERRPAKDTVIKLGHNPRVAQPWVTWQGYPNDPGNVDWGHYYAARSDAETDMLLRTEAKRAGKAYEPYMPKQPKRGPEL